MWMKKEQYKYNGVNIRDVPWEGSLLLSSWKNAPDVIYGTKRLGQKDQDLKNNYGISRILIV
jgi:hypothetical protein